MWRQFEDYFTCFLFFSSSASLSANRLPGVADFRPAVLANVFALIVPNRERLHGCSNAKTLFKVYITLI